MKVEDFLKQAALSLVPTRLLYWLWHVRRRGKRRTEDGSAADLRTIPVQDGVRLDVYWSDVAEGRGPSASLWVLEEEVLRLDCFGGAQAHMHVNPVQVNLALPWAVTPRQYFPPNGVEQQIERGVFELETNTQAALLMNQLARIRRFPIDRKRLAEAANQMRSLMIELVASHGKRR